MQDASDLRGMAVFGMKENACAREIGDKMYEMRRQ